VSIPAPELDATLKRVSARIDHILSGSDPLVLRYITDVSKGRGKQIRPRIMIVVAQLFGLSDLTSVTNCAACCELLHTASLIHDDVIDQAEFRRSLPTVNSRYGNEVAVVVGDYLLALLMQALCEEQDFALNTMLLETSRHLGLGVLEEVLNRNNFRLSVEKYYEVVYYKTGALFNLSARMGAYVGGAPADALQLASEYGKQLGLGFQVVDDLLDISQDPALTGKPAFSDLREGRITLPWIHALSAEPAETTRLIEAYQDGAAESAIGTIRAHLSRLGSIDYAYSAAQAFIAKARQAGARLAAVAPCPQIAEQLTHIEERVLAALPVGVTASV
jgi:geranylgeranyl pyrophosphate synthase